MKLSERFDLTRLPWQRAARLGPLLAWGLALGVTAWVAADLFWRFSAPRPAALPLAGLADPQRAAQAIASRHLMGEAPGRSAAAPVVTTRYSVQAVVTGVSGRPGWAVISIDGGPQQGFVEGQEIQAGVSLARVREEGIELASGGSLQTVKLAERGPAAGAAAPPAGLPAPQNFGAVDAGGAPEPAHRPFPAGFPAQPVPNQ